MSSKVRWSPKMYKIEFRLLLFGSHRTTYNTRITDNIQVPISQVNNIKMKRNYRITCAIFARISHIQKINRYTNPRKLYIYIYIHFFRHHTPKTRRFYDNTKKPITFNLVHALTQSEKKKLNKTVMHLRHTLF